MAWPDYSQPIEKEKNVKNKRLFEQKAGDFLLKQPFQFYPQCFDFVESNPFYLVHFPSTRI